MSKISAGLLMYRIRAGKPEVFLVHPGGPFWKNKDTDSWSIPKGDVAAKHISRQFEFKNFKQALRFVNKVGAAVKINNLDQWG